MQMPRVTFDQVLSQIISSEARGEGLPPSSSNKDLTRPHVVTRRQTALENRQSRKNVLSGFPQVTI